SIIGVWGRVAVLALVGCGRCGFAPTRGAPGDAGAGDTSANGDGGGLPGDALATGANLAFVSSATYTPGAIGGAAAADATCNALATSAGLPGTYVAWLSTTTQNAVDRVSGARGWVRIDGLPIADLPTALGVQLWYTLGVDQNGARPASSY